MLLAIITHPLDLRLRSWLNGWVTRSRPRYQLDCMLIEGHRTGLRWFFTDPGQRFRPADAAILHVDQSLVDQPYLDLAARYPVAVNGRAQDIRKRVVSRNLVGRDSAWDGPVLVKSDLNCGGQPEYMLARRGGTAPAPPPSPYMIYDRIDLVPAPVWDDPFRVVERYLPERRDGMNVLRVWSFMGDYERCSWYTSPETIVKGRNMVTFGTAEVPDLLREERRRLGIDFGKFDFAIGPEGPVLYDANKTPGYLHSRPDLMREAGEKMTSALRRMVAARP